MENFKILRQPDKNNYYLDLAEVAAKQGTCIRNNYGAVIVNNDEVVSMGYTGAPRGRKNCCDIGMCRRQKHKTPSGGGYDKCRSVHAEQNALISAPRYRTIGSTLYLTGINVRTGNYVTDPDKNKYTQPCSECKRMIINAGVKTVVMRDTKEMYRVEQVSDWLIFDDTLDD